jgi:hypothetical protein
MAPTNTLHKCQRVNAQCLGACESSKLREFQNEFLRFVVAQTRFNTLLVGAYGCSLLNHCPTTFRLKLRYRETWILFAYSPIRCNDEVLIFTFQSLVLYISIVLDLVARRDQNSLPYHQIKMVNTGKPSQGCGTCRARRIKVVTL